VPVGEVVFVPVLPAEVSAVDVVVEGRALALASGDLRVVSRVDPGTAELLSAGMAARVFSQRLDLDVAAGPGRVYPGPPPVAALRDCDLVVPAGQMVTVVGPSGSGKSTLLNVLGLLDRPTSGVYRLCGVDTAGLGEVARSGIRGAWIGFVFQSFHLLAQRTATENVAMGLLYSGVGERARLARAAEVLDRVGLGARASAPPSELSGGERQRVAIARALVREPALLLCDEPTGNLDQATAEAVLELIGALHAEGQTVVMITHDRQVAQRGQRTLFIRDGLVAEPGAGG
jgi:putative ABC transport system ATP-binding protein